MMLKPASCQGCALEFIGQGFMSPSGTGANGVMLVGEALGEQEAEYGSPFVGPAGTILNRAIQRGGMKRNDFSVANVVWCRPPWNKLDGAQYEDAACGHCRPNLDGAIAHFRPKVLVALGAVATRHLLPDCKVSPLSGSRGYAFWHAELGVWVIPTVHPAYIARGKTEWTQVLIYDLQHARDIARDGYLHVKTSYTMDVTPEKALKWVDEFEIYADSHPDLFLSCDIETHGKGSFEEDDSDICLEDTSSYQILRCGYSYRPGHALSVPWGGIYSLVHERLLHHGCHKVWWNGSFDMPRIEAAGVTIHGENHDGMDAWHILNADLKKALWFVAPFYARNYPMWKHLSAADPAFYNAMDADVAGIIMRGVLEDLKKHDLWKIYQEFITELNPVFTAMTQAGMPIDPAAREAASRRLMELKDAIRRQIQAVVPGELRPLSPERGYKNVPKDTTGLERRTFEGIECRYCPRCGLRNPTKAHFAARKKRPNPCAGAEPGTRLEPQERWVRVGEFTPSTKGILTYQQLKKHQHYYQGRGAEKRPTTDEKAIRKLMGKYPKDELYPLVLQDREVVKLLGTYIGYIDEEPVDPKGVAVPKLRGVDDGSPS